MEMLSTAPRRRRFRRAPPANLQLTERDLSWFIYLWRFRFLTSNHLASLSGGNEDHIRRRLRHLFDAGYVDRPRRQLDRTDGNQPMAYALGNRGAELVYKTLDIPKPKNDWTSKNREARRDFLEHQLLIADVLVRIELEANKREDLEFIPFEEILFNAPAATRNKGNPAGWQITVPHDGRRDTIHIYPDAIFGLRPLHSPAAKEKLFFLEIDRGSMPVVRSQFHQSSFFKKQLAYYYSARLWRERPRTAPFGPKPARVLAITNTPERVQSLLNSGREASGGRSAGFFLFSDFVSLKDKDKLLELEWLNGRGQLLRLLD